MGPFPPFLILLVQQVQYRYCTRR